MSKPQNVIDEIFESLVTPEKRVSSILHKLHDRLGNPYTGESISVMNAIDVYKQSILQAILDMEVMQDESVDYTVFDVVNVPREFRNDLREQIKSSLYELFGVDQPK